VSARRRNARNALGRSSHPLRSLMARVSTLAAYLRNPGTAGCGQRRAGTTALWISRSACAPVVRPSCPGVISCGRALSRISGRLPEARPVMSHLLEGYSSAPSKLAGGRGRLAGTGKRLTRHPFHRHRRPRRRSTTPPRRPLHAAPPATPRRPAGHSTPPPPATPRRPRSTPPRPAPPRRVYPTARRSGPARSVHASRPVASRHPYRGPARMPLVGGPERVREADRVRLSGGRARCGS
jgi:hypothetical protein